MVWNYKDHEQFLLNNKYFEEVLNVIRNGHCNNKTICLDLLKANIITDQKPKPCNWGWDVLSKIFHIGTQNTNIEKVSISKELFFTKYKSQCQDLDGDIPDIFLERTGKKISLPKPNLKELENLSFFSILKNRKTCRVYKSKSINLNTLSTILFASFGLIHGEKWREFSNNNLKQVGIRKASPASGGLHIEEVYLIAYQIAGLSKGLYHYRPQDHRLTEITLGDFEDKVIEMNFNQIYSKGLAFGIYITARFDKHWWKYKHSRSYRIVLLDIGHVSQTFQLCATALNLNTWITGAFNDSQVDNFLGVDGTCESTILFVGAGHGTGESFPRQMLQTG